MKKIFYISCLFLSSVSFAQEHKTAAPAKLEPVKVSENGPEILFVKEQHDFGTISKGDNGTTEFSFKNTGKEPLIITDAKGSCGCTVPQWPKEPIKPGASASIKVTYDTKRVGAFTKTVTLTSNAKTPSKILTIKGVVNDVAEDEAFPTKKESIGSPLEKK